MLPIESPSSRASVWRADDTARWGFGCFDDDSRGASADGIEVAVGGAAKDVSNAASEGGEES